MLGEYVNGPQFHTLYLSTVNLLAIWSRDENEMYKLFERHSQKVVYFISYFDFFVKLELT